MFLPTVQCTVIRSPDVDSFFLCTTAVWVTKNLATELGEVVGTASYRVYPTVNPRLSPYKTCTVLLSSLSDKDWLSRQKYIWIWISFLKKLYAKPTVSKLAK